MKKNILTECLQKLYEEEQQKEEDGAKIPVEHPGMLDVPKDSSVERLPLDHFKKLSQQKGYAAIAKSLTNLHVWNKEKNPELSSWADRMQNSLKSWVERERQTNPKFGDTKNEQK